LTSSCGSGSAPVCGVTRLSCGRGRRCLRIRGWSGQGDVSPLVQIRLLQNVGLHPLAVCHRFWIRHGGDLISVFDLVKKRGRLCEWCNARPAVHRHHCLIHRMKRHPELDDERNLMLVCEECHQSGIVNNYFARMMFWDKQLKRYPDLREWWSQLPLKSKENFE